MLIGVMGPNAVGKTTWFMNNMDWMADTCVHNITVVTADTASEYHYCVNDDCWDLVVNTKRWKGSKESKIAGSWVEEMVWDPYRVWIVESWKYFIGLQNVLIPSFKKYNGGVKLIALYCTPEALRAFMKQRCKLRDKVFRADYWIDARCKYEGTDRFQNMMNNHYISAGVPCTMVPIGEHRAEWEMVRGQLYEWLREPDQSWYPRRRLK